MQRIAFNFRFPGQYYDAETGLSYNYYRDYEPGAGRYLGSDPKGLGAGVSTYSYGKSQPLRLLDRFGLEAQYEGFNADDGKEMRKANEAAIRTLEKCGCGDFIRAGEKCGQCITDNKKQEVIAELRSAYYVYSPKSHVGQRFCAERTHGANTTIYPDLLYAIEELATAA